MNIKRKGKIVPVLAVAAAISVTALTIAALAACQSSGAPAYTGPVTTVRIGHHYPIEQATYREDAANLRREEREEMAARRNAERQVLNTMGIKIEWVQYTDLAAELKTGASNGGAYDLIRIVGAQQGDLIGSKLLRPIDNFASIYADPDASWMYWPQVYGHNWFLNIVMRAGPDAPLVYNITMLEKVPALKENGKTVLPVHLWKEGKWTWSAFEDYLQKVHDHWTAEWDGRIAYDANYQNVAVLAMGANGAGVYGDGGLMIDTPEAKEAVAFVDRLMAKRLLRNPDIKEGTSEQDGIMDQWRFQWGHSVFTNLQQWLAGDMIGQFTERREKMGVVPFPRPDWKDANDPAFRQVVDARDCYAVPVGVTDEKAEIALKALREYTLAYYRDLAGSSRALDYLQGDKGAVASARKMFVEVGDKNYGPVMLEAWKYMGSNPQVNEYAKNVGIWNYWGSTILGDSLYGVNGATSYDTWVDEKKPRVVEMMDQIQAALDE